MSAIQKFSVRIKTGNRSEAGTDGDVLIGLCGREFYMDTARDDFERGRDQTFHFGDPTNVTDAEHNDPRSPLQIFTEDIDLQPAYIRFAPEDHDDNWNLEFVHVSVNDGEVVLQALEPPSSPAEEHLWLGAHRGQYCYLWTVAAIPSPPPSPRVRARVR
jgi:hypothetical protein